MTYVPDDQKSRPSRLRRSVRKGVVLAGTLTVAAVALGTVVVGSKVIAQNATRISVEAPAAPIGVRVARISREDRYQIPQEFIGTLEPAQQVDLGFESGGTVISVLVDEGDLVAKGQVLAKLDPRSLRAQLDAQTADHAGLVAQHELAVLTASRQSNLADRKFASQQRVDETRLQVKDLAARLDQARAAMRGTRIEIEKTTLRAPFTGQIGVRSVDTGARIGPSAPAIELLQTGVPRVRVGVSSAVAASLVPGQLVQVSLNQQPVSLKLVARRADIDPITRTQTVLFDVVGPLPANTPFGGLVRLEVTRQVVETGFWVPISALVEGSRGLWSLYYLTDKNGETSVEAESLEVIYANEQRAFVRAALPDEAQVVIVGPHRLASGQRVTALASGA